MADSKGRDHPSIGPDAGSKVELLAKLGNGAVAGITGVSIIYPLDMVKTRLQNQKPNAQGKLPYKGAIDCFKTIAIKLAVNDMMRGFLAKRSGTTPERLSIRDGALAGATAGLCQIVKIQMQITAMQVVRQLGIRGMYKGTVATLLRDALFSQKFHQFFNGGKEGDKPATLCVLAGSTVAGILAAGAVTPADVIKTRLQSSSQPSPPYRGLVDTAVRIMQTEGPKAFFKGTVPRCMTMAPLFGIALMMYDLQQKVLGW
ncbi:mitochondrial carrier [Linderina pennispora]|uniref:Mitochondrial carrier n=1 Tax=Linderina pennispora TaxID=61395 RepID=A0A1Y1W1D5_9FUNG|nr:mitochondrial carrier [Linderina pennispora]ORX67317.1 mitochondrial carrier [Linderina pennispora]